MERQEDQTVEHREIAQDYERLMGAKSRLEEIQERIERQKTRMFEAQKAYAKEMLELHGQKIKIQTYKDYVVDANEAEIELETECAMCFNMMVEPIKFPNKECQHRYCRECMDGLFDRSLIQQGQENVFAKCPMCRKYCTLARNMRSNVLVVDEKYQARIRNEKPEEFEKLFNQMQYQREFFAKNVVIQFQVGIRRVKGQRSTGLIGFVRTDNKDYRYLVDKLIMRVEFGFDKLWKQSKSVRGAKSGKEVIDMELSGSTIERGQTSAPLPVKIHFNKNLPISGDKVQIDCHNIGKMDKAIHFCVKMDKQCFNDMLQKFKPKK